MQTLSVGKNTAVSSNPASIVLRRLQHPKNTPIQEATAKFCGRKTFSLGLGAKAQVINDIADAIKKAIKRNVDF